MAYPLSVPKLLVLRKVNPVTLNAPVLVACTLKPSGDEIVMIVTSIPAPCKVMFLLLIATAPVPVQVQLPAGTWTVSPVLAKLIAVVMFALEHDAAVIVAASLVEIATSAAIRVRLMCISGFMKCSPEY
jgi:hypothetical protein